MQWPRYLIRCKATSPLTQNKLLVETRQLLEIVIVKQEFLYRLSCVAVALRQEVIQCENTAAVYSWTCPLQACLGGFEMVNVDYHQRKTLRSRNRRKTFRDITRPYAVAI